MLTRMISIRTRHCPGCSRTCKKEQMGWNTHSHTPYNEVVRKISDEGSSGGDVMEEILQRQVFNWLHGGMTTEYQCFLPVPILSRTDVGML
jgi:hypothetical protein